MEAGCGSTLFLSVHMICNISYWPCDMAISYGLFGKDASTYKIVQGGRFGDPKKLCSNNFLVSKL